MTETVQVEPAGIAHRELMQNLLQLYLYDFSEYVAIARNKDGLFIYPYLDHYWREPDRFPFLISVAGEHAGFALIREEINPRTNETSYEIAEFFVMKKFRRQHVGIKATLLLVSKLSGSWVVRVLENNKPALHFWQHTLRNFSPSKIKLQSSAGYEFRFSNNRSGG